MEAARILVEVKTVDKLAFTAFFFFKSFLLSVYGLTYIFYYLWAVARGSCVYPELLMR